ncbi:hypothetical protein ACWE42_16150 [Sutcliffiella cohnii]
MTSKLHLSLMIDSKDRHESLDEVIKDIEIKLEDIQIKNIKPPEGLSSSLNNLVSSHIKLSTQLEELKKFLPDLDVNRFTNFLINTSMINKTQYDLNVLLKVFLAISSLVPQEKQKDFISVKKDTANNQITNKVEMDINKNATVPMKTFKQYFKLIIPLLLFVLDQVQYAESTKQLNQIQGNTEQILHMQQQLNQLFEEIEHLYIEKSELENIESPILPQDFSGGEKS